MGKSHGSTSLKQHLLSRGVTCREKPAILIVDDEPDFVDIMSEFVSDLGIFPIPCLSGLEALEKLQSNYVDLAIIDINMPEMTGQELVQKMRALGFLLPVIFCSGFVSHLRVVQPKEMNIYATLPKPFDEELLAKLLLQRFAVKG